MRAGTSPRPANRPRILRPGDAHGVALAFAGLATMLGASDPRGVVLVLGAAQLVGGAMVLAGVMLMQWHDARTRRRPTS